MMISNRALLFVIALVSGANAFTPSHPSSSASINKYVQETQQFQPVAFTEINSSIHAEDDDENDAFFDDENNEEEDDGDYIVNVGDLEGDNDQEDVGVEDDGEPPAWFTSQQRIAELRETYRRHEKDTGSPEFQVAGMTERITYLTKHLQQHPKDYSTRRGLVALVNKRRRLLNYLYKKDELRYQQIVQSLGIRHKAPGRVPDRAEQYSRFPQQKAVKKHLSKRK